MRVPFGVVNRKVAVQHEVLSHGTETARRTKRLEEKCRHKFFGNKELSALKSELTILKNFRISLAS